MPPFEVKYADTMRALGYGYALWQADPFDQYEKVEIGTAGIIS
jgi:hypothetical protein